jgi:hypothetical protein
MFELIKLNDGDDRLYTFSKSFQKQFCPKWINQYTWEVKSWRKGYILYFLFNDSI